MVTMLVLPSSEVVGTRSSSFRRPLEDFLVMKLLASRTFPRSIRRLKIRAT